MIKVYISQEDKTIGRIFLKEMGNYINAVPCHVTPAEKWHERELLIPSVKELYMCCRMISLNPSGLFIDEQNYEVNGKKIKSQRNKPRGFSPHWQQGVSPFPALVAYSVSKAVLFFTLKI